MLDLKQKELYEWQLRNFPRSVYHNLNWPDLVDRVLVMERVLGMSEEVGEICHQILKWSQGIREGVDGLNRAEVADGVVDTMIFGIQLLSELGIDAEEIIAHVTNQVLERDWKNNPKTGEGTSVPKPSQSPDEA